MKSHTPPLLRAVGILILFVSFGCRHEIEEPALNKNDLNPKHSGCRVALHGRDIFIQEWVYDEHHRLAEKRITTRTDFYGRKEFIKSIYYRYDGLDRLVSIDNGQVDLRKITYNGDQLSECVFYPEYGGSPLCTFAFSYAGDKITEIYRITHITNKKLQWMLDWKGDNLRKATYFDDDGKMNFVLYFEKYDFKPNVMKRELDRLVYRREQGPYIDPDQLFALSENNPLRIRYCAIDPITRSWRYTYDYSFAYEYNEKGDVAVYAITDQMTSTVSGSGFYTWKCD